MNLAILIICSATLGLLSLYGLIALSIGLRIASMLSKLKTGLALQAQMAAQAAQQEGQP